MSPEMLKAQVEIQIMQMKAQMEMQIAQAKAEMKMGTQAVQSEAKTQMKMDEANLKAGLQAQQTVATMEQTRAKSDEQLRANAALAEQNIQIQGLEAQQDLQKKALESAIDVTTTAKKKRKLAVRYSLLRKVNTPGWQAMLIFLGENIPGPAAGSRDSTTIVNDEGKKEGYLKALRELRDIHLTPAPVKPRTAPELYTAPPTPKPE